MSTIRITIEVDGEVAASASLELPGAIDIDPAHIAVMTLAAVVTHDEEEEGEVEPEMDLPPVFGGGEEKPS